jgi:transcriptional regulator with XRE-family HTH domain
MNSNTIGKRVKRERNLKKMKQRELAEMTNIGITSLSKIENGKFTPKIEDLEKIAKALKIDFDYLVGSSNTKDQTMKFYTMFRNFFGIITTSNKYKAINKMVVNPEDFTFSTSKNYLMFSTDKFELLSDFAKAEDLRSDVTEESYDNMLKIALVKHNKNIGKMKTCYLISSEQIEEIIRDAIINQRFVESLFEQIEITAPYMEKVFRANLKK